MPDRPATTSWLARRQVRVLRLLKLALAVNCFVILVVLVLLYAGVLPTGAPTLAGSRPPEGQQLPPLHQVAGMQPPIPGPRALAGSPTAVLVTCFDCRSGDVYGGFLSRMGTGDMPEEVDLLVAGWGGNPQEWRREWSVPAAWRVHSAGTPTAAAQLRSLTRTGDSGILYLYDGEGRWRSTWHLGQVDAAGITGDLELLARGG